jgi:hypothetical protein
MMEELITNKIEDYESLAIYLASNPVKFKEIKNKLINNKKKSNIFNTKIYTTNLEKAYKEAYEKNKKNIKPEHMYLN